jgi:membrane protease YdiL (CAAX protease family)
VATAISLWFINFAREGTGWLSLDNFQFDGLFRWGVVSLIGYVAVPVIAIKVLLRERVSDYGLRYKGVGASWRIYALLFALSVPFVVFASAQTNFQETYPFYTLTADEAWWPFLWLWWLIYAAQFVALEFFFRGFIVHGLKLRMGINSVFVMVVPYVMIHFNKPPLEALSAIFGGTVLGFLSLKTGSVWWGAALHIAIAATMDLFALAQTGFL